MKTPMLLLAAISLCLFPGIARADEILAAAAVASREAAVILTIDYSPTVQGHGFGAFVSEDGLALVTLALVCGEQKPRVTVADGTPLKFGAILGIFPEQDVALMKFAHRPKVWLRLAATEPDAGASVALVLVDPKHPRAGKIPSVMGPVMAKRSVPASGLRETAFAKVLSLGAGMSPAQRNLLSQGCFAVNAKGELAAFFFDIDPAERQVFITLTAATPLITRIGELSKGGKEIPFPLPEALNPRDPVLMTADWRAMMFAILREDRPAARATYDKLARRYPGSYQLRTVYLNHSLLRNDSASNSFSEIPVPNAADSPARKIMQFTLRANSHLIKDDRQGAIPDLKAAVALCPKDFPKIRKGLADVYVHLKRLDEAEPLYREAYAFWPESIEMVEALANLLDMQGKYEEAIKLIDRAMELERIYQQP